VQGLGEEAHFDAELRHARLQVDVPVAIGKIGHAACQGARGSPDERGGERAQKRYCQEAQLETGVEKLVWVEEQKTESHGGEQVQRPLLAEEEAGDDDQRECCGRPHARRVEPGDERIQPGQRRGQRSGQARRHKARTQHEKQKGGHDRHVRSGDDQRVKGAGGAVIVGPHLLHLKLLPQQHRLHHGGLVRVMPVERIDAGHGGAAQVHHCFLERRAAAPRKNKHRPSGAGGCPVDIVPRQVMPVIECARVLIVARGTHPGIELDSLAVSKRGKGFVRPDVKRDLDAGLRLQLQQESFAFAGKSRRFDHASAQDDYFAARDVQLRRRARPVNQSSEGARGDHAQQTADAGQHARAAQHGDDAQRQERSDGQNQLMGAKGNEACRQDPGGNCGHRS